MRPILPPLSAGSTGPALASLHEALVWLLGQKLIRALDPPNQPTAQELKALTAGVRREQAAGSFGDATGQVVRWFQIQNGLGDGLGGVVEERTADRINELLRAMGQLDETPEAGFVVRGHVEGAAPGLLVRAFDQDFRGEEWLGDSPVGGDGRYEIPYRADQFSKADKGSADLRVTVIDPPGRELVSSDVAFNAPRSAEIDLVVPATVDGDGPSEYEHHVAALVEVLAGVPLLDVARGEPAARQRDIDFLAGDTGIDRQHVAGLVLAVELAADDRRPRPEVFYGWLRRGLPGDWVALAALPTTTLRAALVAAVDGNIVPRWVLDQLDAIVETVPSPDRSGLGDMLATAAWPPDRVGAVLAHVDGIHAVSDDTLGRLVDEGALVPDEAQRLGLTVSLHNLTAGAAPAVETILTTEFPQVPGHRVQHARDLALLEPDDWQRALKAAEVPPPAGLSPEDHARGLALQAAGAFPDAAFRHRAATVPPGLNDAARRMQPVIERNPDALTTGFDDLDLDGIPARDQQALREAHATLRDLANDHPGLGLAQVLSSGNGDGAKAAARLVGGVADVLARNPDVDFLGLDYRPGSLELAAVDFGGMSEDDRTLVVADLRANQRIHSVTLNPIATQQVKRAGLHSASALAMTTPGEVADRVGLSRQEARAYHDKALELANAAALDWFRLYEVARDDTMTRVRAIPTRHQFFRQLTGFRQLFDDQPWCACDDCQSVLSPAAYVVDLLHYIERWILAGSFAGQVNHPLHLEKRRPDLWDLELTCEATKTIVPTLDIVDEVLERYLRDVVSLADTDAVYRHLADQEGALGLPFTLPLERLRVLLGHFGLSRHDVARALHTNPAVQARARLDLSLRDHTLITQARPTDGAYLGGVFGLGTVANTAGPDAILTPVDLAVFLRVTGLAHDELVTLLETHFVSRDGSAGPAVDVAMEKRPGAIQNDAELVHNLTVRRLDRLHRFLRLWRRLPWTIAELDYALERLSAPAASAVIAAPAPGESKGTLERLVHLLDLNVAWDLPVDELFAVVDAIPAVGLRQPASLFDRLFNPAPFVARDGLWPPPAAVRFSHPGWQRRTGPGGGGTAGTASPADNSLARLLAGLQLSDQEFVELVAGLTGLAALDHQPATATTDESIALSRASVDALHRHARVRALLGLTVADFLVLLRLGTPAGALRNADDVAALVDLAAWQKAAGFTVPQLGYLVEGTPPAGAADPAAVVDSVVAAVDGAGLEFADTILSQLGLTDEESRATVRAPANLCRLPTDTKAFEELANGHIRLKAGATTGVTFAAGTTPVDPAALALLLRDHDALHLLDVALGDAVERSADEVAELRELADPLDAAARAAVTRALQGSGSPADATRLRDLITATLQMRALLASPVYDLRGLRFARQHPAVFFGPAPATPPAITLDVARNVAAYAAFAAGTDAGFTTASAPVDRDVLESVLVDVGAAGNADLAVVLRSDEAHVAALRPHVGSLPANPFEALDRLAGGLELTDRLGVSGETLELMTSESTPAATYATLARAAEDVFGTFRAKYPSERVFREKVEPYEDELRGRRRDGLVDYIVHRWPEPFADADRIYEYFLMDVMVDGCARTTRVVSAMSSLQLYVERVLMNLERSDDWDGTWPPTTGLQARFADASRRDEWQWRKHYRVWEANRKVFLYPENYIEPELRDDKTLLFGEFEDSLLVQRIDGATVGDAYTSYLSGFDELARLKIAGAYYDAGARTLHLFGVTQDDAPVFYYRSMTERGSASAPLPPLFSGWQRLSLQIPARRVSPILFEGRLYLFWVETATRPLNTFVEGTSEFGGYRHTIRVKYSMLRLDGEWSAPQLVHMVQADGVADARIVDDPLDKLVINRMKDELKAKNDQLGPLAEAETAARTKLGEATTAWADALADREDKKKKFQAPPSIEEAAAMAAGAFLFGIPPEVTLAGLRAVAYTLWQIAIGTEQRLNEERRQAADALSTAMSQLRQMKDQIATLTAAIAAEVVRVKWDKSNRDHKNALDSYRPQGWEWDRVYPDVYRSTTTDRAALRLMLVPRNPPELTTTDPNTVTGPGARPIRSGELDVSTGTLREMASTEAATVRWAPRLNWSAGRMQARDDSALLFDGQDFFANALWLELPGVSAPTVGHAPITAEVQAVNGWAASMIVETSGDAVWMRKVGAGYGGLRLSTSLTRSLASEFWRDGPASLLDPTFQLGLTEARSAISPVAGQSDPKRANPLHPDNPFLTYYRETFFHIPFLIADHLNGQQDFSGAQSWYHRVFDPTAADGQPWRYRDFRVPPPLSTSLRDLLTSSQALEAYRNDPFSPHAIARTRTGTYQKSIVMKYVDNLLDWGDALFGQFTTESVNEATMLYVMAQEILGPRPTQLGSCLVDRSPRTYRSIRGGLTDVSDFLVELEAPPVVQALTPQQANANAGRLVITVPEAAPVVAQSAQTLVGTGPGIGAGTGDGFGAGLFDADLDGAGGVPALGGVAITPALAPVGGGTPSVWKSDAGTPLATMYAGGGNGDGLVVGGEPPPRIGNEAGTMLTGRDVAPIDFVPGDGAPIDFANGFQGNHLGVPGGATITPFGGLEIEHDLRERFEPGSYWPGVDRHPGPKGGFEPVEVVPPKDALFCIPPNQDLLGYWDRVESRLFNIRNCRDITGVRRVPALFAPELDVRMLVRMKAAGLSLDDVLDATSGNLPPYRFSYIIDKAKQYASTVQSFGAQLLSALEKRDAEELSHLRAVHEQNLLKMATRTNLMEIAAAEDALEGLRRQKSAAEHRRDHYVSLSAVGSLPQETKQQELQRFASDFRTAAGIAQVVASILTVIPDAGAPTAMKFGGSQLGAAGRAVAESMNAVAAFNDAMASRSGVEAANQRRDQDWRFQAEVARRDIAQIDKQISAAEIRRDIAVHALEVHEQTVAQTEELFEFFRDKFTSIELYRVFSVELRRLYRLAFNDALAMARLAEQAFRAERRGADDDAALTGNYWDADTAGLLAGERLLIDLQGLERQYIEHNYRQLEVDQSFSLAQFAPDALAELRITGRCSFDVPEWFFDLSYPGHYRRRLKAVRMTVPCVVGPHANVGATLRLAGSSIRPTVPDDLSHGLGTPEPVPSRHSAAIATSRAQNDAGVFEFNFRDERYMPFEGAGAISSWEVSLPRSIRAFDYSTISDVILHLSYTAVHDEDLRDLWDGTAAALLAQLSVADPDAEAPLTHRFSLRTDAPDAFHRLVTSPVGTAVAFTIDDRHLPMFIGQRKPVMTTASLAVVTPLADLTGTVLEVAKKPTGTAPATYKPAEGWTTPTVGAATDPVRSFEADVLATPTEAGLSGPVEAEYLVKLTGPGPLQPVDTTKLRDVVLTFGYHLTR